MSCIGFSAEHYPLHPSQHQWCRQCWQKSPQAALVPCKIQLVCKASQWGGLRSAMTVPREDVPSRCPHHMYMSIPAHSTAVDRLSYLIPLGLGLLLLKPAVFPTVKQLCQEPPDQQEHQANEGHTSNSASHDQRNVGRLWALCGADRECSAAASSEVARPPWQQSWQLAYRGAGGIGVPFLGSTMTVYISLPSSWIMRKEIQQFWESFSLHCLLTLVDSSVTWMLGQAWEQFFSKGPLMKPLHSTQELQNRQPQLNSAGAEDLSPGFDCSLALPKYRQSLPAPAQEVGGSPPPLMPSLHVSLTHICHRATGSRGTPGRRGAGSPPSTGSGCSGRSRGCCTRCHGCSSSHLLTSCTGRHCPGTRPCTCTPRSHISHGLRGKTF